MPELWARPLLDVVAGLRSELRPGVRWPDNLRLLACPAAGHAGLPLSTWVLDHFAALPPRVDLAATRPPPAAPGHVAFSDWRSWAADGAARAQHLRISLCELHDSHRASLAGGFASCGHAKERACERADRLVLTNPRLYLETAK